MWIDLIGVLGRVILNYKKSISGKATSLVVVAEVDQPEGFWSIPKYIEFIAFRACLKMSGREACR